ncbi:thiol:disulfide interchange protein DsbG [Gallaecimonas sp. GXIMD1310]|uniref:thiol:disulfide interchange protein DsbG n=1 Tax=Gallaecimonas sp. GXIMD1310 TaxID=3131926 RepID=UPI00324E16ED
MRALLALVLASGLAQAADKLPAPIAMMEQQGVKIVGTFDAPGGLKGYAAQVRNQALALYLTPDGKHVITGYMYDTKGNNVSEEILDKLVYQPQYKKDWQALQSSNYIKDGADSAKRVIYMFSDANCPYCNHVWRDARPWVEAGKVQIRHVMVGILRQSSLTKAAAIMASKDPSKTLHNYEQNREHAQLPDMAKIPDNIRKELSHNYQLMQQMGINATPAIYFKNDDGQVQRINGAPRGAQLEMVFGPKP